MKETFETIAALAAELNKAADVANATIADVETGLRPAAIATWLPVERLDSGETVQLGYAKIHGSWQVAIRRGRNAIGADPEPLRNVDRALRILVTRQLIDKLVDQVGAELGLACRDVGITKGEK